jgi:hypothetical protein
MPRRDDDYSDYGYEPEPYQAPNNAARREAVASIFRNAWGTEASPETIDQWTNGPFDIARIQQEIYNGPEAQAYNQRRQEEMQQPAETPAAPIDPMPMSNPAPSRAPSGPASGGTLNGMLAPIASTYQPPPGATAPNFVAPVFTKRPDFTYTDFVSSQPYKPPSSDDILQDPSFVFRMKEGQDALENSAAGKGVLRSSGTLKDILRYGQNLASTEYGNIDTRNFRNWQANDTTRFRDWTGGLTAASDAYKTNYGGDVDAYDRLFAGALAENQSATRNSELARNNSWNEYLAGLDLKKFNQQFGYNAMNDAANRGLAAIG